jgi:SUMO ligase MMS21 Smc5/6 complex component
VTKEKFRGKNELIKTDTEGSGDYKDITGYVEILKIREYIRKKNKEVIDENTFITRQMYDSENDRLMPESLKKTCFCKSVS